MKLLYISLFITFCFSLSADTKRVLFIGNSYTAQAKNMILHCLEQTPYKDSTFEFMTSGGKTLKWHLENSGTLERIQNGNWDYVVLQDQSQTPALPGIHQKSFYDASTALSKAIKGANATPVLYMTWGRRDGDSKNPDLFPDYETMQKKLTSAYKAAARKNKALLAPIGEVWAKVRRQNKTLGKELYKKDGSHPDSKGAFLVACTFMRTLFNDTLESCHHDTVTPEETKIIKTTILTAESPK